MTKRMATALALDGTMTVFFLGLMADRYTGNGVHEWLGTGLCALVLVHVLLNRAWLAALPKTAGKYPVRALMMILAACFLAGAVISAVPLSQTVFAFTGLSGSLFLRSVHTCFAYWAFLLAACHCGLCADRLWRVFFRFRQGGIVSVAGRVAAALLAVYGAYVFVNRDVLLFLTMQSSFGVWQEGDGALKVFLEYLAMFHGVAWSVHGLSTRVFQKQRRSGLTMPISSAPCRNGQEVERIVSGGVSDA